MDAVAYLRVSRQTQETERQEKNLIQYAKDNEIEIVKVFQEKITGVSKASERQEYSAMLNYIEENQIKLILTTEISRFSRTKKDLGIMLEELIENKVDVVFKDNNAIHLLDKNGRRDITTGIIIDIIAAYAQQERETAIIRNKDGMQNKLSKGGAGYGKIKAFGYKSEKKILIVDEEEAQTVKLIFNKYLEGLGCKQIANHLNTLNIETKYNRIFNKEVKTRKGIIKDSTSFTWKDGTIYGILKNKLYIGERHVNDYDSGDKKTRKITNTNVYSVQPIISKEIFYKVEQQLYDNYNKRGNNNKYENILKDKITCECGRGYYMHKRADNKDSAYKCLSIRYNENCGNYSIGIDRLNNAVYFYLKNYVKYNNDETEKQVAEIKIKIENHKIIKESLINQIAQKNQQFEHILEVSLMKDNFQELITKTRIKFNGELMELNKKLDKISIDISENYELIKTMQTIKFDEIMRDVQTFKKYAGQTINELIIKKVPFHEVLKKIYPHKQDKLVHIDLSTIYNTQHTFIISQRTNIMLFILMDSFYDNPVPTTYLTVNIPKVVTI